MKNRIVVLGSTGSVGRSTMDVLRANREHFRLLGLAAGDNIRELEKQISEFAPLAVSVKSPRAARELREKFSGLQVFHGREGLDEIVSLPGCDAVVAAITGTDGLQAAFQAVRLGHRLCLANKETLVAAGELINREAAAAGAEIVPIDSEQSAIFQCLAASERGGAPTASVRRVILTASGGPFFRDSKRDLDAITVAEALAHPTWSMGRKITIDSATLMNKALEIIEASHLFRLGPEQIDVVIHPQSVVHSLVEFVDASVLAQLGVPDMRLPILYALSHPERIAGACAHLDLAALQQLEFFAADPVRFPSLRLAYDVLRQGRNAGAVFNTANEVAVEFFLAGRIGFTTIFSVVAGVLEREEFQPLHCLEDVLQTIALTRKKTIALIEKEVTK
jgi:1-deoxy-D-xylulose-5-phosphate reductoisomerase